MVPVIDAIAAASNASRDLGALLRPLMEGSNAVPPKARSLYQKRLKARSLI
jgi:hypothetical protein